MKTKKHILIIDGHPRAGSFCDSWAKAYEEGANENFTENLTVIRLELRELNFNLNLENGYKVIQPLEDDLVHAQKLLKSADHIVIITPIWWGGPTALLKGFIDRTMLPGFAFKYRTNSVWWINFLPEKQAMLL